MAAKETLQKSLNANYDLNFFQRNVLHPVFGNSLTLASTPERRNINPSEERLVKSVKKYGTIALADYREMDLYDVELAENIMVERSKVSIGAVIKKYIYGNNAALVNFHYQNQPSKSWRLSFIAKEQQIEEGEIVKGETNPKRYTYVLGPNETCRTAAERFEILSRETEFTIDKFKSAFEVEKLSKKFFDEYKEHYLHFVEHLGKRNFKVAVFNNDEKAIRDFAKKLLGRIVFLYFVQKKGWLGASNTNYADGSPDFLQQLFLSSGKNESFYNAWLKKLYYDTLNNHNRPNDSFKLPDGKTVCIPFLNGGLFEDDDPKGILTFPGKLFTDLFDFFNQYNFTIYEDSPDDHTVAVDPEMLGHIFENLLEDNKDKGAYYTPKEIVHYMCQESLIEYLATKLSIAETASFQPIGKEQTEMFEGANKKGQLIITQEHKAKSTGITRNDVEEFIKHKQLTEEIKKNAKDINKYLDEVKICDPAIGSGAFPMGLLHEIFNAKQVLNSDTGIDAAEVKLNIIQNSIYGVDIEKGAVDIARLRFWLSLIVDEDKPRPLPNLDYKIVVGDSLVPKLAPDGNFLKGEIVDIDWDLKTNVSTAKPLVEKIKTGLNEIVKAQKKFFREEEPEKKKKYAADIRNLKIDLLINQLTFDKLKYAEKNKEQGKLSFTEKTREEIKKETEIKLKIAGYEQEIKKLEILKKKPAQPLYFFDWKLDFPEIMNPTIAGEKCGFDIVIGNPPWGAKLEAKEKILFKNLFPEIDSSTPNSFAYFIGKSRIISHGAIALLLPDSVLIKDYSKTRKLIKARIQNLNWYQNIGVPDAFRPFVDVEHDVCSIICKSQNTEVIHCSKTFFNSGNKKFNEEKWTAKKNDIILDEFESVFNLMLTQESLSILKKIKKFEIIESYLQCHEGIHTGNSRDILFRNTKENKYCKPLYYGGGAGDTIENYYSEMSGWFVDYREELIKKNKGFYASLRDENIFIKPKIYITRTGNPFKAFIDENSYASNNFFSLQFSDYNHNTVENLKIILPFIISKICQYFIRTFAAPRLGNTFVETKIYHLLKFRIPQLSNEVKKKIIDLVDKIIEKKQSGRDASKIESKMDLIIYKLYQLSYDEVLVVDKEFEKQMSREEYDKLDYGFEYSKPDKTIAE